MKKQKKKAAYTIVAYSSWDNNDRYVFAAKNKKQVVGLTKTIVDNFNPVHIDIMKSQKRRR